VHLGGIRRAIFVRDMFMLRYTTTRAGNMVAACQARPDPPTAEPHHMTADSVAMRFRMHEIAQNASGSTPTLRSQHRGSACIAPLGLARAH
jgi:hypothetical protein